MGAFFVMALFLTFTHIGSWIYSSDNRLNVIKSGGRFVMYCINYYIVNKNSCIKHYYFYISYEKICSIRSKIVNGIFL